jgi:hypothetical protein
LCGGFLLLCCADDGGDGFEVILSCVEQLAKK